MPELRAAVQPPYMLGRARASIATEASAAAMIWAATASPTRAVTMPTSAPTASISRTRSRLNSSATPRSMAIPSQVSHMWSRNQSMP